MIINGIRRNFILKRQLQFSEILYHARECNNFKNARIPSYQALYSVKLALNSKIEIAMETIIMNASAFDFTNERTNIQCNSRLSAQLLQLINCCSIYFDNDFNSIFPFWRIIHINKMAS